VQFIKNKLSDIFSEKTIIISGNQNVKHFKLKTIHYLIFFTIISIAISYVVFSIFNIKIKEQGLSALYSDKRNLEIINTRLTKEINILATEVGEINNYLIAVGKDVDKSKENIEHRAKELNKNTNITKDSYVKDSDFQVIRTTMSNVFEQINDRHNHMIRVAKHILPTGSIAQAKNISFNNKVNNINLYKTNLTKEIQSAIKVEKAIKYMPIAQPIYGYKISSTYGNRMHPVTHKITKHQGVDLMAPPQSLIYASGSGIVSFVGKQKGFGNLIEISHNNKIKTKYAHLNKILVKKGQLITIGQKIGIQGNTGCSTGAHLHYEVLVAGKNHHPYQFISAQNHVKNQTARK
jgi:murein DD-endopeptidase MepM/ murein hydrolase activator NlpD